MNQINLHKSSTPVASLLISIKYTCRINDQQNSEQRTSSDKNSDTDAKTKLLGL
jgi:hypothetical protein